MRIGFIGLGDQGGPMAEMMLADGLDVCLWARRAQTLDSFRDMGPRIAGSLVELGMACDLVSLCVTGDDDVRSLVLDQGLMAAMQPGSILAIHSTIFPSTCWEIAEAGAVRGIQLLDAPVSGSGARARARNLLMMIAGEPGAIDRVRPAFSSFASPIVETGAVGTAMTAKLINNLVCVVNYATAYEALALTSGEGLSPDMMRVIALAGSGRSWGFEIMPRSHRPERAAHMLRIMTKDVDIALAALPAAAMSDLAALARRGLAILTDLASEKGRLVTPEAS